MRSGRLRHRASLYKMVEVQDNWGHPAKTWNWQCDLWAAIEPIRSREMFEAGQVVGEVTHRIVLRYSGDIEIDDKFVWNSRNFYVTSIVNRDERNIEIELLAVERK